MKEELDAYNAALEDEMEREKQKHQRNLEALNHRKEEMIKEKKQKLKVAINYIILIFLSLYLNGSVFADILKCMFQEELQQMAAAGSSKEEQDQIVQAHQRDLQTLINKMDADKLRMQSNLQERLKKRREEKLKSKENKLHDTVEESKKELSEKQRSEREDRKAEEVCN